MPVADKGEKRAEPFQIEKCGMETQTCWTLQELRAGGHLGLFKKIRKQSQLSKLKKRGQSLILTGGQGNLQGTQKAKIQE